MALDYAVLRAVARRQAPPTLRIYRWERPAVTIGYFQVLQDVVHDAACRRDGVPVIRRITGGGAVLHDQELTYSVTVPLSSRVCAGGVPESFRDICRPVIRMLAQQSIAAAFKPVNDIVVGRRKISGCAQTRRQGVLLQHGTLLLAVDGHAMVRYLRPPCGRSLEAARGLTCLRDFLGPSVTDAPSIDGLCEALAAAFQEAWGFSIIRGGFTRAELAEARQLEARQFARQEWNYNRQAEAETSGDAR
jgi:lipoate-protein ligase A